MPFSSLLFSTRDAPRPRASFSLWAPRAPSSPLCVAPRATPSLRTRPSFLGSSTCFNGAVRRPPAQHASDRFKHGRLWIVDASQRCVLITYSITAVLELNVGCQSPSFLALHTTDCRSDVTHRLHRESQSPCNRFACADLFCEQAPCALPCNSRAPHC